MSFALDAYSAMPVWIQNAALSLYGLRVQRTRYGRVQRETLRRLRDSERFDAAALEHLQLSALSAVVARARREVPFYRERLPAAIEIQSLADLRKLPLLTKDEVKAAGLRLSSEAVPRSRRMEIHTGGTTGKPLTIYCDRETVQRNYAFFARFRLWAGVPTDGRVATFAGRRIVPADSSGPYWRTNLFARTRLFSSYHISTTTLDAYLDALAEFSPALIDCYPSSIEPLAVRALERGLRSIRPRAVITSSETLFPETRHAIEQAFGCPVFDHYGAAEMSAFITQCENGSYHVNPEFGVVELLRDGEPVGPGEQGEIVATGFVNPVMPLIRYATGDRAVSGETACACGRHFPTISMLEGRMDDVVITPDGRRVGRLDPIFKAVSSLYETRIVQDRVDHLRVEVVLRGELPVDEERILVDELRARVGPAMSIDVVRVDAIERTGSGKLRTVVNLCDPHRRARAETRGE